MSAISSTIIGTSGQAIIAGKWSDSETVQYRVNGWAHSLATHQTLVASLGGGEVSILNESTRLLPLEGAGYAQKGVLRIAHRSSPYAMQSH